MKTRRESSGFTAIELMVVIAVIAILAAMAVPSYLGYQRSALRSKCLANLRAWHCARESFFADNPTMTQFVTASLVRYFDGVTNESQLPKTCPANSALQYAVSAQASQLDTLPSCSYSAVVGSQTIRHVLDLYQ